MQSVVWKPQKKDRLLELGVGGMILKFLKK
jgi:hypothetical protein